MNLLTKRLGSFILAKPFFHVIENEYSVKIKIKHSFIFLKLVYMKISNKSIVVTVLALSMGLMAQAQIEKGSQSIGSTLEGGFNSYKPNETQSSYSLTGRVEPTWEHFVNTNLSVGIGLGYKIDYSASEYNPSSPISYPRSSSGTTQTFNLALSLRKFWFVHPKVAFYLQPKLSSFYYDVVNYSKNDNPVIPANQRETYSYSNYWLHTATLSAGVSYFAKPQLAIKVQSLVTQYSRDNERNSLTLIYPTLNLLFGVDYYFGRQVGK